MHRQDRETNDATSVLRRMEAVQDRIIAYLRETRYPTRRKLDVVASILGMSISEITPAVDALERAGRLKVDYRKGSLVLSTPHTKKGGAHAREAVAPPEEGQEL